jgi:hypothetical protein
MRVIRHSRWMCCEVIEEQQLYVLLVSTFNAGVESTFPIVNS